MPAIYRVFLRNADNYRYVEVAPGTPVYSHGSGIPKKKNPARARGSKLRLEEFLKKKEEASQEHQKTGEQVSRKDVCAGNASNTASQLISVSPGVNIPVETGMNSPIPQVDGEHVVEHLIYSFKSDYAKEDIEDTLSEILPKNITYNWISRERTRPLEFDAEHLCSVVLHGVKDQNFSWPIVEGENVQVIK